MTNFGVSDDGRKIFASHSSHSNSNYINTPANVNPVRENSSNGVNVWPAGRSLGAGWTKVIYLKVGDEIAVQDGETIAWQKIQSIEYAGYEQVWDIEVENTHNFVANGIIAHNTYISGNVGIGTTNPSSFALEVAGNLGPEATNTRNLGSASRYFNTIYVNNIVGSGALGYWNRTGTVLSPATAGDIVNVGDGTVALPAYSFTNDTDSGLYRIASDKIALATGATARIAIDATGNVGIGTTGPGAALDVNSGAVGLVANFNSTHASGGYIRFQNSGSAVGDVGTGGQILSGGAAADFGINVRGANNIVFGINTAEKVRINSSGNVGIGTTGPQATLHIIGSELIGSYNAGIANAGKLQVNQSADTSSGGIALANTVGNDTSRIWIDGLNGLKIWAGGAGTSPLLLYSGDFTLNQNSIVPFTSVSSGAVVNTLYLKQGNVGIGTTGPGEKLDIAGGLRVRGAASNPVGADYGRLNIDTDSSDIARFRITGANNGVYGQYQFIAQKGDASDPLTRMVISTAGNVGIGTVSPGSKLAVSGNAVIGSGYATSAGPTDGLAIQGNVGIGTTGPGAKLEVAGDFIVGNGTNDFLTITSGGAFTFDNTAAEGDVTFNMDYGNNFNVNLEPSGGTPYFNVSGIGGSALLRVTNAGNVGIGTTGPANKLTVSGNADITGWLGIGTTSASGANKLEVKGSSTSGLDYISTVMNSAGEHLATVFDEDNNLWIYRASGTARPIAFSMTGTEAMRITTAGNVGIGTTGPQSLLSLVQSANSTVGVSVYNSNVGASAMAAYYLRNITSGSETAYGAYLGLDTGNNLNLFNQFGNDLIFGTNNAEKVRIKSNGNVGIGTTGPVSKLHIHGNYTNDGTGGFMLDATDTSDPEKYVLRINPYVVGGGQVGYQFQTKSFNGGTNVPLAFDGYGNVGIGTT
ncbi:hypothetical protein KKG44_05555 [Patescibacteria group bacterium]|nr:hypothetical protein [Patescibacteria group bacterium]